MEMEEDKKTINSIPKSEGGGTNKSKNSNYTMGGNFENVDKVPYIRGEVKK